MSRFLDNVQPRIFPRMATSTVAGLSILSNLEKLSIIEEAENRGSDYLARNAGKLDLSNSIYDTDDEE